MHALAGNGTPSASSGQNGVGNGSNPFGNFFGGQGNSGGSGNSGNSGSSGSGSRVSSAAVQKVQSAVMPGLVVISSDLQYQGDAAAATGMVISKSGLVLTNNHVIANTTGLTATVVSTGQRYKANWLGYDKTGDIAVIQLVGASHMRTVPVGDATKVKVGDGVVAMGNANGTGQISTVTGSITGLNRSITASDDGSGSSENLTGMLQTDANIIQGDSGGPISNTSGQVIGMDTAASSDTVGFNQQDTGFAIPINRALSVANQIISGKSSSVVRVGSTGFLGVVVIPGANGQQSTQGDPHSQLRQQEQNNQQNSLGGGQFGGAPPGQCLTSDGNAGVPTKIAPVTSGTLILGSLCGTPAATAWPRLRRRGHRRERALGVVAVLARQHPRCTAQGSERDRDLGDPDGSDDQQVHDAGGRTACLIPGAAGLRRRSALCGTGCLDTAENKTPVGCMRGAGGVRVAAPRTYARLLADRRSPLPSAHCVALLSQESQPSDSNATQWAKAWTARG